MKPFIFVSIVAIVAFRETLSAKAHVAIEKELRKALGITNPPTGSKDKIEIPEVLREQYYQQTGLSVNALSFRTVGANTAYANTVRSFPGSLVSKNKTGLEKEAIFEFNFNRENYIGEAKEVVQSAILKAYWNPHLKIKRSTGSFKVRIYDLKGGKLETLQEDLDEGTSSSDSHIKMLMDIKKIYHRDAELDEGYYEFDVTPAVQRWVSRQQKSFRLVLEKGEMKVQGFSSLILPNGSFESAMILVYSEDARSQQRRDSNRQRRSPRTFDSKKNRKRKGPKNHCKVQKMYVDFSEVGWNDWIVAPPGYDANKCIGECPLSLSDHLNTTNHAIVQTMVNSVNPSAVPRPCCVPTELSPISMLYLDEYEKVVLKNYDNMAVEGCGCR